MASKIGIDVEANVGDAGFTRLTEQARKAADEIDRLFRPRSGKSWVDYELVKLDKYLSKLREIQTEQGRMPSGIGGGGGSGGDGGGSGGGGGRSAPGSSGSGDRMQARMDEERESDRRSWWVRAGLYSQRLGGMAGAMGGALGGMMTGGTGGVAGAAGNILGGLAGAAIGTATANPFIGLTTGALLSNLGGTVGGKIDAGVGTAKDDAIATSRLRYSLGALGEDFERLRYYSRSAADAFGVVDSEAIRMGREMAKMSGASSGKGLFADVETAGLLARATGMEPGQVGGIIGSIRGMGGARDSDQGARRLGAIIGETIGKTGYISKSAEVMSALANYVTTSERSSLLPQDETVGSYGNMLATMVRRSGIADVSGMANVLMGADATFRAGGGSGEASQNFRLGVYQRNIGKNFSGLDVGLLNEAGMFATPAQVFAKGGPAWTAANAQTRARYESYLEGPESNTPIGDMLMRAIEQQYGGRGSDEARAAIAQELFGGSRSHADALYLGWQNGGMAGLGDGVASIVGRNVGPRGTMAAAPFLHETDRSKLEEQARLLLSGSGFTNKLTAEERESLGAKNADDLREAVVKLTATREWEADQGERAEQSINAVENAITRFAADLLPISQQIRDAVLDLVAEADAANGAIRRRNENVAGGWSMGAVLGKAKEMLFGPGDPDLLGKTVSYKGQSHRVGDLIDKAEAKYPNIPRGMLAAMMQKESGGSRTAKSPKGATGMMQLMPGTAKRFGVGDMLDPEQNVMGGAAYVDWLYDHFGGDVDKTLAGYNAGEHAVEKYGGIPPYPETQDYVKSIKKNMKRYDEAPQGAMTQPSMLFDPLNINGRFELVDHRGINQADPILKNIVHKPRLFP